MLSVVTALLSLVLPPRIQICPKLFRLSSTEVFILKNQQHISICCLSQTPVGFTHWGRVKCSFRKYGACLPPCGESGYKRAFQNHPKESEEFSENEVH